MFKLHRRTERGASLVEYGLLLTVFGAAVLASIDTLTSAVEDETVVTAEAIGGNPGTIATVTTTTVASSSTTTRPPNDPPVVYAGPDATIDAGDTITQAGTVNDANTPTDLLFIDWTVTSADGTSNETVFGNDVSIDAWWTTPGTYLVRLTASDGFLTTSDDAYITVEGASTGSIGIDYLNTWGNWQDYWQTWYTATARVDIEDEFGNNISGVTVTGNWNVPGHDGTRTCTTNSWGRCYFDEYNIHWSYRSATFTVTNVSNSPSGDWDGQTDSDSFWMW